MAPSRSSPSPSPRPSALVKSQTIPDDDDTIMGGMSTLQPQAPPLGQLTGDGSGIPVVASDSAIVPPSPVKASPPPPGIAHGGSNIDPSLASMFPNGGSGLALPPLGHVPVGGLAASATASGVALNILQQLAPQRPGLLFPNLGRSKPYGRAPLADRTGAGIKKAAPAPKARLVSQQGAVDAVAGSTKVAAEEDKGPFRFLDLPGEIRNLVYRCTWANQRQALLVHRPRMASFRLRTRLDRQRALASDIKDKEIADELADAKAANKKTKVGQDGKTIPRETNRPFYGLTQVCTQIRREYRSIYMSKQEIGMDLTQICDYLNTFYFDAPAKFVALNASGDRGNDMPFKGNLTIAVADKPLSIEIMAEGTEIIQLLDIWANSHKIEAGFGRYLKKNYAPQTDGEAKDLYRLFGRKVLPNRSCSAMNNKWRTILRNRELASVALHRKPAAVMVPIVSLPLGRLRTRTLALPNVPTHVPVPPKPFIHMLFRAECAEPWMTQEVSVIPTGWLEARGFGLMEHFVVKVGLAPAGVDNRIYA